MELTLRWRYRALRCAQLVRRSVGWFRTCPENRTSGIPIPLAPTHRDASVMFFV